MIDSTPDPFEVLAGQRLEVEEWGQHEQAAKGATAAASISKSLEQKRMAEQQTGDVALLVDWENLKWGLLNQHGRDPNIGSLVDAARDYGRLVVARAYAEWTLPALRADAPNLYKAGVEPIFVPCRRLGDVTPIKNSADVRLAVDAIDIALRLGSVKTFILVTGDSDLIHPLNYLRLNGRSVVIVGVGGTMASRFDSAADKVLIYERDIDPSEIQRTDHSAMLPMEDVFAWITDLLEERSPETSCLLSVLGHWLLERHGFSAQKTLGMPLKALMLSTQAAGHIRLSTVGGRDYAALPNVSEPVLEPVEAEEDTRQSGQEAVDPQLEALAENEHQELIAFIDGLERSSPYMTFRYLTDNLTYHSVIPRLSREQVRQVLNDMVKRELLFTRSRNSVDLDPTAVPGYAVTTLCLNREHEEVAECLRQLPSNTKSETADLLFHELLAALGEAKEASGYGYFPAVQGVLERRAQVTLRGAGFQRASDFFNEAARRGLIRVEKLPNGADIVLTPDELAPSLDEIEQQRSVLQRLDEDTVRDVVATVAAAEARVGVPVQTASLIQAIWRCTKVDGEAAFRSSEVNRLLKRDMVEAGLIEAFQAAVKHRATGEAFSLVAYRLNKNHPVVQSVVSGDVRSLPDDIDIRPLKTLDLLGDGSAN